MILSRPHSSLSPARQIWLRAGIGLLLTAGGFALRVQASSLSSTPVKVALYQGVVTIVPTASTILELGNGGTDVAANTNILFKPSTGNALAIGQQTSGIEGGEVVFNPAKSQYPEWHLDTYGDYVRFYLVPPGQPGQEKFTLGKNGDAHVMGKLCLGFAATDYNGTSGSCIDSWADIAGSGTPSGSIEDVLLRGNTSNYPLAISVPPGLGAGPTYFGSGALIEASNTTGYADTLNPLYAYNEDPIGSGSAIYAENPNGYAGYFSGRVVFHTPSLNWPAWPDHNHTLRIYGPIPEAEGALLEVYNANATGLAAKFTGSVSVHSTVPSFDLGPTLLTVTNTRSGGGTTLRTSSPSQSGSAVYALGSTFPRGAYGLTAAQGSGAGVSYAGFFRGQVGVEGYIFLDNIQLNNSLRTKWTTELQVCPTSSDTCIGRYVYTSSGTPPLRTSATQFCREDPVGYTTICTPVYSGAPVTQLYELR